MTIVRLTVDGVGIGSLPVSTVADACERGELVRLDLPVPMPAMVYDAIWRSGNYPGFCDRVTRLAQECAKRYTESHRDIDPPPQVKVWTDR